MYVEQLSTVPAKEHALFLDHSRSHEAWILAGTLPDARACSLTSLKPSPLSCEQEETKTDTVNGHPQAQPCGAAQLENTGVSSLKLFSLHAGWSAAQGSRCRQTALPLPGATSKERDGAKCASLSLHVLWCL